MTLWYVGDPCYAINDDKWHEFCDIINQYRNDALERDGIQFGWKGHRVYVYNSGLGGDGSITLGKHRLCVDAGLLSVLPLEVCESLSDKKKTEGEHGCHSIIRSHYRPVFDITTNEFPNVTLEYNESVFNPITGYIERGKTITLNDTTDHTECDVCGEWTYDNNMVYNDHQGAVCCGCEEEE